jgi:aminoglycoside phosphotransferase family enzyme
LRLNRRFAADLYVDVVPITQDDGQLRVAGSGKPIEYAVRMRQFAATDELSQLLDANAVSTAEIARLADLLAFTKAHLGRRPSIMKTLRNAPSTWC